MYTIKIESRNVGTNHPNINGIQRGSVVLHEAKNIRYRAFTIPKEEYDKWLENYYSKFSHEYYIHWFSGNNIPGSDPRDDMNPVFYRLEFETNDLPNDKIGYTCIINSCAVQIINEHGNLVDHFEW